MHAEQKEVARSLTSNSIYKLNNHLGKKKKKEKIIRQLIPGKTILDTFMKAKTMDHYKYECLLQYLKNLHFEARNSCQHVTQSFHRFF